MKDHQTQRKDLQKRINALQVATIEGSSLEQLMLHEPILRIGSNGTPNPGASTTHVVVFESRRQAIFKPFGGQHPNVCANFQQDAFDAVTHEVVAWRLAYALGGHWEQLVPTAVLRHLERIGPGVLINWRRGTPSEDVFSGAVAQAYAAAFWDSLIGQQDRHDKNFRYDIESRRLALIDHGFSFATPNAFFNESCFTARRKSDLKDPLDSREVEALEALLHSEDLYGLRRFLREDRARALEDRANAMLEGRRVLLAGSF